MLKVRRNMSPPPPEPCALSICMKVLAGAWAPNIIWHLKAGPRRFNELRVDIPPISAKVLSARLRELRERGVLVRHLRDTSPPSVEYELTELGAQLVPALEAIATVGHALKKKQQSVAFGEDGPAMTAILVESTRTNQTKSSLSIRAGHDSLLTITPQQGRR